MRMSTTRGFGIQCENGRFLWHVANVAKVDKVLCRRVNSTEAVTPSAEDQLLMKLIKKRGLLQTTTAAVQANKLDATFYVTGKIQLLCFKLFKSAHEKELGNFLGR